MKNASLYIKKGPAQKQELSVSDTRRKKRQELSALVIRKFLSFLKPRRKWRFTSYLTKVPALPRLPVRPRVFRDFQPGYTARDAGHCPDAG